VNPEHPAKQEPRDQSVRPVKLDPLDLPDLRVSPVKLAALVRRASSDPQAPLDK